MSKRTNMPTRRLVVAATLSLVALAPIGAMAQANYPSKPVTIIVPFPPGGGNDVVARLLSQGLGKKFNQRFIVQNVAGANGSVGLNMLARAEPDGYTLGVAAAGPMAVNPNLYSDLPYDPVKDFEPIANVVNTPLLLVLNPKVKANTIPELIAEAKANPDKFSYGSPGIGNSGHLAGELFNSMAGLKIVHVPYSGNGPAMTDLLGGQVQMLWSSIPSVLPHVQQGALKGIAIGSAQRLPALANIPTVAETVPGYEAYSWVGLIAPKGTPRPIIDKLNAAIKELLSTPEAIATVEKIGAIPVASTPDEFREYIKAEIKKWGDVIRDAKITAENEAK
ncbi:tripartite tricarboxylate transporter substrate binding protein [Aquabacter sp. CN5-332]|uniref:Bug family tripartite tricarboxylate transporter substrate binding protein n=1 Tax=Aquabacter sp. CN5-332 TaxID=3156608 RepID=UPI0032B3D6F4